jgi:triosephosphate isomerase (TIM)
VDTVRLPLIAGNWKMNLDHLQSIAFVQKLAWSLKDAGYQAKEVEVAVFPPFTDLRSVQTLIAADDLPLALGAQDLSVHDEGAHTGDISGAFLKALECRYVIVGHSERRADHHETNDVVAAKAATAIRHGLIPIVCVGETSEDLEKFGASKVPVEQLEAVLAVLKPTDEYVVAYEPVWAIGSGQAATPDQAEAVAAALREVIRSVHNGDVAEKTRILYGGSVKSGNIAGFMKRSNVDGALVGGASLDIAEFSAIARFPRHVTVDS